VLIIFDVDGTLCDTQEVDARCFSGAFECITGRPLPSTDWSQYPEVTNSAIVRDLLEEIGTPDIVFTERLIVDEFVTRLGAEGNRSPELFQPIPGADDLFEELKKSEGYTIAIATGCWAESARLKLTRCGFMIENVPFASSSDTRRRSDIITLTARRSGCDINGAVYIGDGLWDFKASRELGMRFVGIEKSPGLLQKNGVSLILTSFTDRSQFFEMLNCF
jgi:phosphoglycolate phosphatase-like HAD superfamily hydrolase